MPRATGEDLTNADLPRVINGRITDPIEERPYSYAFGPERIANALNQVGALRCVPLRTHVLLLSSHACMSFPLALLPQCLLMLTSLSARGGTVAPRGPSSP